jgi:type I restriction enzyme S subunit
MTAMSETKKAALNGKYAAYPEYKDSGVEWLGQIPSDWQITKLKHIASIFGRIGFRGYTVNDIVNEGEGAIVLSPSNIFDGKFSLSKVSYLSWDKYYESPEIMVERNDILLVKTGSTYGKSSIIKNVIEPMTINPQMALIKKTKINPSFLAYWLSSELIKAKIEISNTGSGMPTMTQENINEFPITLPNKNYDEKIAAFLDHETAKIDTLIEKQQQLIELLKEKRQAVISHAVTKGLNPDASMKDSGVEWLGEVPEHWEISQAKYVFLFQRGHDLSSNQFISGEIPVYGSNGIIGYHNQITTKGPSITIGRSGSVGKINKVLSDFWAHNTSLYLKWQTQNSSIDYIYYLLLAMDIESLSSGSAVGTLDRNNIHKQLLALPPLAEQLRIVEYLNSEIKRFVILTKKSQSAINLMQERRTALISAAVTGKIDVRHWVASKTNEAQQEVTA